MSPSQSNHPFILAVICVLVRVLQTSGAVGNGYTRNNITLHNDTLSDEAKQGEFG